MKRSIYVLLAAAVLFGAAALPRALAADAAKGTQAGPKEKRAEKWLEKSGLSQEQADKLKAAFKAEREAMKPLRRELRDALLKLKDKVEDEAGDKDVQAALDRVEQAHKAIQVEREKSQANLASFLPATQRAKMMLRMAGRMGGHEQGMGHEGGFGPRGGDRDRGSKREAPEQKDEE